MGHTAIVHLFFACAVFAAFLLLIVYLQAEICARLDSRSQQRKIICAIPTGYEAPFLTPTPTGWVATNGKRTIYSPEETA